MNASGPYYSYALLNTVLSHSLRWGQSDPAMRRVLEQYYGGGHMFGKMARNLVFDEINRGVSSIPTIQSLLLLSAQECGFGNSTQAWSYSGLALRLMDHMGILVDGHRFPGTVHLTDEDVEIRHRLYWSCFIWDKMISLYLGRSPSMQHTSASPPPVMREYSVAPAAELFFADIFQSMTLPRMSYGVLSAQRNRVIGSTRQLLLTQLHASRACANFHLFSTTFSSTCTIH